MPGNLSFSPDGRTLLVFELGPEWSLSRWDVRSGSLVERKPLSVTGSNWQSAFSHDGRLLAIANEEPTITLCDLATGHRQSLHVPAVGEVDSLEFSPDDRFILLQQESSETQVSGLGSREPTRDARPNGIPRMYHCWTPSQDVLTCARRPRSRLVESQDAGNEKGFA